MGMKHLTAIFLCLVVFSVSLPSFRCRRANVLELGEESVEPCEDKSVIQFRCTNCLFEGFFDVDKQLKLSKDQKLLYSWACSSPGFQPKNQELYEPISIYYKQLTAGILGKSPSDVDALSKSELLEWAEKNGLSSNNTVALELGRLYVTGLRSLVQLCVEKGINQEKLNAALDQRENIAINDANAQRNTTIRYQSLQGTSVLHKAYSDKIENSEKEMLAAKIKKNLIIAQSSSILSLYQQLYAVNQNSMDFYFDADIERSSTVLRAMKKLVNGIVAKYRRKDSSVLFSFLFEKKIKEYLAELKKQKEMMETIQKQQQQQNKYGGEVRGNKNGRESKKDKKSGSNRGLAFNFPKFNFKTDNSVVKEAVDEFIASQKYISSSFTLIKQKLREFYVEFTVTQNERVFCDLSSFESFKDKIRHESGSTLSQRYGFSPSFNPITSIDGLLTSRNANCAVKCLNFKPKEVSVEEKIQASKQKVSTVGEQLDRFREIVGFLEKIVNIKSSSSQSKSFFSSAAKKNNEQAKEEKLYQKKDAEERQEKESVATLGKKREPQIDPKLTSLHQELTAYLESNKIQSIIKSDSIKIEKTAFLTYQKGKNKRSKVSLTNSLAQIISFLYEIQSFEGPYQNIVSGIYDYLDRRSVQDIKRGRNLFTSRSSHSSSFFRREKEEKYSSRREHGEKYPASYPRSNSRKKEIDEYYMWAEEDNKKTKKLKQEISKYDVNIDIRNNGNRNGYGYGNGIRHFFSGSRKSAVVVEEYLEDE